MARFELKLPKMGESVAEATVTNWLKQVGDKIQADEPVLEVATDKVDNEVPSEVSGILIQQLFAKDAVVQVGQTIAIIEVLSEEGMPKPKSTPIEVPEVVVPAIAFLEKSVVATQEFVAAPEAALAASADNDRFFSPLVKNIAKQEDISEQELESILGTGKEGRVTKDDILVYIKNRNTPEIVNYIENHQLEPVVHASSTESLAATPQLRNAGDEIIEMDRMRKLISGYMVASLQTAAHVQSFIEVDVTGIVKWRDRVKNAFEKREGEKLTFTPIFMQAVAKAIKDFPMLNSTVEGDYIVKKKNINLGMATALPNGNLIVPVIKNADQLNLVGMAKAVNDLGMRAKMGKLKPDDTQGGTYTVTNIGSFGSIFGTPIINQPQVGILALGAIRKVPAVIETPDGDFIGIRQKMFLSHSYDHRIIDGALGGSFVKRVAEYLEAFDSTSDF